MLLLERITASDGPAIEAGATVRPAAWYLDERGAMPAWVGIELMAQAVAAQVGLKARLEGNRPKPGVLLGSREFRASFASVRPGTRLRIAARQVLLDESGFGAFDCKVFAGAEEFCAATLKVYQPEDFEAFLMQATA